MPFVPTFTYVWAGCLLTNRMKFILWHKRFYLIKYFTLWGFYLNPWGFLIYMEVFFHGKNLLFLLICYFFLYKSKNFFSSFTIFFSCHFCRVFFLIFLYCIMITCFFIPKPNANDILFCHFHTNINNQWLGVERLKSRVGVYRVGEYLKLVYFYH